jgi:Trypsin-like peptidase domain/Effector-associated domain 1
MMPDWTNATGLQLKIVQDALLSAFPRPDEFEMMLALQLDKSYAQLTAGSANYRVAVFQVLMDARSKNWLGQLIASARRENSGNTKLKALEPLADLTAAPTPNGVVLEDIVRDDGGFQDVIPWVERLDRLRAQICRIEIPVGQAVGTGWLVENDLLLTNWHVVRRVLANERQPGDVICRFDYATSSTGTNKGVTCGLAAKWCEAYSEASHVELGTGTDGPTETQLDYALLRLEKSMGTTVGTNAAGGARGFIATKRGTPAPADNSVVFVLQHPLGDPLKLAIGVAKGINGNTTRLMHDANTESGSSGSPCLNAKLELVALHNAGDPLYDGVIGTPTQNQAVPLEPILERLETQGAPKFWTA